MISRHSSLHYVIILSFFPLLFLSQGAPVFAGQVYNVVYYNPDITSEDSKTMVSAMKTYIDYLGQQVGAEMTPFHFTNLSDLQKWLTSNTPHLGIYSPMFIVENYKKQKFTPCCIVVIDGETYYEKVIVVRKDSPFKTLADLKGKTISTTKYVPDDLNFLNKIAFASKIDLTKHFSTIKTVDTANAAVMAVLYKATAATLTNYGSFMTIQDFNPQAEQHLNVIFTSVQIPLPGLVTYDENVTQDFIRKVKTEVLAMHKSPQGSQALLTFHIEAWRAATIQDWAGIAKLLQISLSP
ncbi:phosphate/phosphite/phosphonate ABC transporter substrate-binding protein [candidate division CSSED10-310 bacterium]|uniref:Phosphate/phosphite/phosphonate ABC transporter substrate-binding protein n=1 Tax=candidate division CSSED10-310 bacterium TaxID=2855610 RepID=A0ABV6Z5X3_UNCC1